MVPNPSDKSDFLQFPPQKPPPRKRKGRRLPQCLTDDEYAAVVARARYEVEEAHTPAKRLAARRDEVILHLGLRMGLRLSEFCNLNVDDLDLTARRCRINQGKGGVDRVVPVPVDLVDMLRAWIGERRTGPMFPSTYGAGLRGTERIDGSSIEWRVQRLGELAEMTRRLKPHMLRHSAATRLLKKCGNLRIVQMLLGHRDIGTTVIYTHVNVDELAAALDAPVRG